MTGSSASKLLAGINGEWEGMGLLRDGIADSQQVWGIFGARVDLCRKALAYVCAGEIVKLKNARVTKKLKSLCAISPVFHFAQLIIGELSTLLILLRFTYFLLINAWHF